LRALDGRNPLAVILGLDPRIERRGALSIAKVAQADNPILGSSPRMTAVQWFRV